MMRIVIAGGHGNIALILERLLSRRGDSVAGFIRNPDHAADLRAAGAEAIVLDLEQASADAVASHLRDADAVVFAAGAGPGSGSPSRWPWLSARRSAPRGLWAASQCPRPRDG